MIYSELVWEDFLDKVDFISRLLKDRWDMERTGEGIWWDHNVNKNVEAELAHNMQGRVKNLFKLKPTTHWLVEKDKNRSIMVES